MRVLITGATGFIGGHTARAAVEAGHDVVAFVRNPDKLASVCAGFGIAELPHVIGDMSDETAIRAALTGCDAVIHCAAVVSLDPAQTEILARANTAGAETVLGSATELGLDPVVHLSSTSALFAPGSGPLTIDHSPTTSPLPYAASKAGCESVARRLQDEGHPVAIVYPSGVLGPPSGESFGETGDGISGFVAGGAVPTRDGAMSVIDVRDLASIVVALLEPGNGSRRIMAGGHLLSMQEIAEIFRDITSRRFPVMPTPPGLLRGMGRMLDSARKRVPFNSPMNEEGMTVVTMWEGTVDSDFASLGVTLRSPEVSFAESIDAWHEAGLLTDRQRGRSIGPMTLDTDDEGIPLPPDGYRVPGNVLSNPIFRAIGPRVFPPFHRLASRLTGGRTLFDSDTQPMLMLVTTGAKSGKRRETPLAAIPLEAGKFLVVGSNFARENHPAWTSNLLADPRAEIVFRGAHTLVTAELLEGTERARRWETALGWNPGWTDYDEITERDLRLFELTPR